MGIKTFQALEKCMKWGNIALHFAPENFLMLWHEPNMKYINVRRQSFETGNPENRRLQEPKGHVPVEILLISL